MPDVVPFPTRDVCPKHGMTDCSPLLNGCSYFVDENSLEESVENHPGGKGVPTQRRALLDAQKWSARIEIARDGYAEALAQCRELGLGNAEIARAVGKSETAIRMHFKRREAPTKLNEPDPLQLTIDDMDS